jgi:hypothetical protein
MISSEQENMLITARKVRNKFSHSDLHDAKNILEKAGYKIETNKQVTISILNHSIEEFQAALENGIEKFSSTTKEMPGIKISGLDYCDSSNYSHMWDGITEGGLFDVGLNFFREASSIIDNFRK